MGLAYSFIDKNKHAKKSIAASMENVAEAVVKDLDNKQREDFHELLQANMDILSKNLHFSMDYTCNNLKRLIKDESIVVLPEDKDSAKVIMGKNDDVKKMQEMIDKGIPEGVYAKTEDDTLQDLKRFQELLYRNFSKSEKYTDMLPSSNQPVQLYGAAKTHKFDDINDITVDSLKFRPIIALTGTYMYKTAQVISEYLKHLYEKNDFIIKNTQDFAQLIRVQPPLEENEEYVYYDVESLFTNVPIHDTIKYKLEEIYIHNKLQHIFSKLFFKSFYRQKAHTFFSLSFTNKLMAAQ